MKIPKPKRSNWLMFNDNKRIKLHEIVIICRIFSTASLIPNTSTFFELKISNTRPNKLFYKKTILKIYTLTNMYKSAF